MKYIFLFFGALSFSQTPLTDTNFLDAINTCLSTNPENGLCSDSEYGAMPYWNVSNITNMDSAFLDRTEFNADISSWDVSSVVDFDSMFRNAESFNQPIGSWNMGSATKLWGMFFDALSFNQPLNNWDVSNVVDFTSVFRGCSVFNQPLNNWNVSNAVFVSQFFLQASSFNQPLDNWDFSNVRWATNMFQQATSFNQDIGMWNTSSLEYAFGFFALASSFNQDLSDWDISNVTTYTWTDTGNSQSLNNFFHNTSMSTQNYDLILASWSNQDVNSNLFFVASGVNYCSSQNERQSLIDDKNWTIIDGGYNCNTASVDESDIFLFSVYPNPAEELLHIDASYVKSAIIYNITGKKVFEVNDQNRIDVSSLSKGVYFIQVFDGINSSTRKFLKK